MLLAAIALLQAVPAGVPTPEPYRPASATIVAEPVAVLLAGFDADGDGRTTRAEATAGAARSFGSAPDMGYIAFADWAERWLGDRNAVPSPFEIDRNGDNRITATEFADRMGAIFARLDADKDGVLTRRELLTIRGRPVGGDEDDRRRRRRDRATDTPQR